MNFNRSARLTSTSTSINKVRVIPASFTTCIWLFNSKAKVTLTSIYWLVDWDYHLPALLLIKWRWYRPALLLLSMKNNWLSQSFAIKAWESFFQRQIADGVSLYVGLLIKHRSYIKYRSDIEHKSMVWGWWHLGVSLNHNFVKLLRWDYVPW